MIQKPSQDSEKPWHAPSLIRAFVGACYIPTYIDLRVLDANNENPILRQASRFVFLIFLKCTLMVLLWHGSLVVVYFQLLQGLRSFELRHKKTCFMLMRKQKRRSAAQYYCAADQRLTFRYIDTSIPLPS